MTEPRGSIYLINRAPIDITYQHTVDFVSAEQQLAFWRSLIKYSFTEYSYVRRERRFIQIDKKFEDLEDINYLFFQSRGDSKYYFCFVTDREYVNDETTRIYFEIDVLQTFMFDYAWKPSYIAQAHVDRWDANYLPIYSRTEEGLNYGSEYVTDAAYRMVPDSLDPEDANAIPHGFYLIYLAGFNNTEDNKTITFTGLSATTKIAGNPIPYSILAIPHLLNPMHYTSTICGIKDSSGSVSSVSTLDELQVFMSESALGNFIKQIVYVPYLPFKYSLTTEGGGEAGVHLIFSFEGITTRNVSISSGTRTMHAIWLSLIENKDSFLTEYASLDRYAGLENKMPSAAMWNALKANPMRSERDRRYESKLLCFPYRYNIFTDWTSAPCLIKNEYLAGEKITIKGSAGMGFNTPRRFWIDKYRADPEGREASVNQLLPLEQSIISDAYYNYMLQNRNQISANIANFNLSAGMGLATGTIKGGMSGAATGGVYGAIFGAVSGMTESAIGSEVNYTNMIRSENAKQGDLKNLPDTIANSNDVTLAIQDKACYLTFYRKAISCDAEERLAQYWHMFGYIVQRVEIPQTRSRMRYNFIKTIGANIESGIEQHYIAAIKAIYDKGVTIWHYDPANKLLDYSYENPERNLI